MSILLNLFLTFAKIGLFTFGGGLAMISTIEYDCVEQKKWITHEELMDMTVIAETTPGPIAINCATYTGYRVAGLSGSLAATFGMILPSFVIIFVISQFLDNFLELTLVAKAFQGIKIAVGLLILNAAFSMLKKMQKKKQPLIIMGCACALMLLGRNFSSLTLMAAAGAVSLGLFLIQERKGGKK